MKILHGDILFSESPERLSIHENSYIGIENGCVLSIWDRVPEQYAGIPVTDHGRNLIIPAFSDLHIHAPQYAQRGTGMDLLLSDWLNTYTFPEEAKFTDTEYARVIYTQLADNMLRNGTFHAAVYATLHVPASRILAEIMEKKGLRGYVGKVNMDVNSPEYLCEDTKRSLHDAEDFVASFASGSPVKPILTPRFAPTCSREQICGLGRIAAKYGCGMQSHIVESRWEAAEAVRLFPECTCDTEIYEKAGLLDNGPNLLGHFIFPSEADISIAKKHACTAVHCPDATSNVIAGIAPVHALMNMGVSLAIGTDIGAGQSPAVYRQAASAVRLSKLKEFYEGDTNPAVTFPMAFYMATKGGGSVFEKTGSFEKGYRFDALVLKDLEDEGTRLSPQDRLERFCYIGDDRNIAAGYIGGEAAVLSPEK